MHILIIEDDDKTAAYLAKSLGESGYLAERSADGQDGLHRASNEAFDALIVDRMLPGLDGLAVIQTLRAVGVETPVLILSALAHVDDRVRGLRAGGDDYLAKPFAFSELLARLESLFRRPRHVETVTHLKVADLELDMPSHQVTRAGSPIELRPQEFRLLEYLMRHAGEIVTRSMLFEGVWDFHFDPHTNVIEVHISRLRQKIDHGFAVPLLHTARGGGYCLRAPA
jgi:two-component system OmpR family response regulator